MKQNIKIFLIALIIGMIVAFFISFKFKEPIALALNSKATYFYVGSYNSLELANQKSSEYQNSLIYQDGSVYKIIIGVYHDNEVIDLMSSYFHDSGIIFYQDELKVDSSFLKNIDNYELLIKASDNNYYESINNSILNLFSEYIS